MGQAYLYGANVAMGIQTGGDRYWQQFFGCPRFGVKLSHIGNTRSEVYGHAVSLYPLLQAPIFRAGRFALEYEAGLGLTYYT